MVCMRASETLYWDFSSWNCSRLFSMYCALNFFFFNKIFIKLCVIKTLPACSKWPCFYIKICFSYRLWKCTVLEGFSFVFSSLKEIFRVWLVMRWMKERSMIFFSPFFLSSFFFFFFYNSEFHLNVALNQLGLVISTVQAISARSILHVTHFSGLVSGSWSEDFMRHRGDVITALKICVTICTFVFVYFPYSKPWWGHLNWTRLIYIHVGSRLLTSYIIMYIFIFHPWSWPNCTSVFTGVVPVLLWASMVLLISMRRLLLFDRKGGLAWTSLTGWTFVFLPKRKLCTSLWWLLSQH